MGDIRPIRRSAKKFEEPVRDKDNKVAETSKPSAGNSEMNSIVCSGMSLQEFVDWGCKCTG